MHTRDQAVSTSGAACPEHDFALRVLPTDGVPQRTRAVCPAYDFGLCKVLEPSQLEPSQLEPSQLEPSHLALLEKSKGETRILRSGSHVFHAGDDLDHMFVVLDGWVMLYQVLDNGKRQVIDFLMRSDTLGYFDTQGGPVAVSALCLNDVAVWVIRRTALAEGCAAHPEMTDTCLKIASDLAMRAQGYLVNIGARSAVSRVAFFLTDVVLRVRRCLLIQPGEPINFPITQQDLADALGLSAVYINKIMNDLDRGGIAKLRRGKLFIRDFEQLKRIAAHGAWEPPSKQFNNGVGVRV